MLTEQLNTGAQEPRVLNIYRNYLFTTQENQLHYLCVIIRDGNEYPANREPGTRSNIRLSNTKIGIRLLGKLFFYENNDKINPTEDQTQNRPRIHENSKQTNTEIETSDSCFE
jgi:hypothetical protein